jgi:N-methylhydantoinase B
VLPSKFTMTIRRGDVFRHVLAGAGGWGDPLERDPAAVLKDVKNELLSPAKAAADYGVVTSGHSVDANATAKRRAEIRAARGWREVPAVQREDPLAEKRKAA